MATAPCVGWPAERRIAAAETITEKPNVVSRLGAPGSMNDAVDGLSKVETPAEALLRHCFVPTSVSPNAALC
jgi:hypothetical protein